MKSSEWVLTRKDYGEKATEGEIYIDGVWECYSLEDVVRPQGVKIPGQTAIPAGKYRIIIDDSQRFKRLMPHILDVPMFEGVRMHPGNDAEDTEGCILVGTDKAADDPNFIGGSRNAFNALFNKLEEALKEGEVWITIC